MRSLYLTHVSSNNDQLCYNEASVINEKIFLLPRDTSKVLLIPEHMPFQISSCEITIYKEICISLTKQCHIVHTAGKSAFFNQHVHLYFSVNMMRFCFNSFWKSWQLSEYNPVGIEFWVITKPNKNLWAVTSYLCIRDFKTVNIFRGNGRREERMHSHSTNQDQTNTIAISWK